MKYGYRESSLSKSMRGAADSGPALASITIVDESGFGEPIMKSVRCDGGELRLRLLDAIMKGSPIVKPQDAALLDTGRVRRAVWDVLTIPEAVDGLEPLLKAKGPIDLKAAAAELDQLVRDMENRR
jgi:hypothetical protein